MVPSLTNARKLRPSFSWRVLSRRVFFEPADSVLDAPNAPAEVEDRRSKRIGSKAEANSFKRHWRADGGKSSRNIVLHKRNYTQACMSIIFPLDMDAL